MKLFFLLSFLFISLAVIAQNTRDSVRVDTTLIDTSRRGVDSTDSVQIDLAKVPPPPKDSVKIKLKLPIKSDSIRFIDHQFFSFTKPVRYTVTERKREGKEGIFYSVIGLLIFFAIIKNYFNRYFTDLFKVFFRTSMRQKQIKEQLLQNPLPSLLFNIFFVFSIGLMSALLLVHFHLIHYNFWLLTLYCIIGLAALYTLKYLFLKISGWLFQTYEAANTYIFIIFTTNKVIGVSILPFLVTIAFTYGIVNQVAVIATLVVVILLYLYRYFLSFLSLSNLMKISIFHFLVFFTAFEIIPLLLINKLLFVFIAEFL